jgi:hypothetical protein
MIFMVVVPLLRGWHRVAGIRSGRRRLQRKENCFDHPKDIFALVSEGIIDRLKAIACAQLGDGAVELMQYD